jgi:hypothetical protein
MKLLAQWLSSAIVVIVAISLCSTRPAFADSYTIFDLGSDNARSIYGIDTAGDVVIWSTNGCGGSAFYCYATYVNGVATSDGSIAPVLAYDNGTACGSTPAGFHATREVCNNGWIGLGSLFSPNGNPNGAYLGSGSDLDFLGFGSVDRAFLNSAGDFAWVDGLDDEMYVAILNNTPLFVTNDLFVQQEVVAATTPEPGTLLLMGTGLIFFTAAIRRKANR